MPIVRKLSILLKRRIVVSLQPVHRLHLGQSLHLASFCRSYACSPPVLAPVAAAAADVADDDYDVAAVVVGYCLHFLLVAGQLTAEASRLCFDCQSCCQSC